MRKGFSQKVVTPCSRGKGYSANWTGDLLDQDDVAIFDLAIRRTTDAAEPRLDCFVPIKNQG